MVHGDGVHLLGKKENITVKKKKGLKKGWILVGGPFAWDCKGKVSGK